MTTTLRCAAVVLSISLVMQGCGGSSGGEGAVAVPASMQTLLASGAVVGGQGKFRIIFSSPLPQDAVVNVSISSAVVATVPGKVTAPKGATIADFPYDAKALGTAVLFATYDGATANAALNVVDKISIAGFGSSEAVEAGGTAAPYLALNINPPTPTTVTLTSDAPAIATVLPSVTFTPFLGGYATALVNAISPGQTSLHAKLGDSTANSTISVVAKAKLRQVNASPSFIEAGGQAQVSVSLDAIAAAPVTVAYTSSNTAVAASGTVVVPAGLQNGTQLITVAAGATVLHMTLGTTTIDVPLFAAASPSIQAISATSVPRVGIEQPFEVTFDVTASKPHAITLTSSDPSVVTVGRTPVLFAGQTTASGTLNILKEGTAQITASFNGEERVLAVVVGVAMSRALQGYANTLSVGAIGGLSFDGTGYGTLSLSSSDPSTLAVPSSVPFYYGSQVQARALKAGRVRVTATYGAETAIVEVIIVEKPSIEISSRVTLNPGQVQSVYASVSALPAAGALMSFTSSNPGVVPAPQTVSFGASTYAQFQLQGLATGTAIITATLGTATQSMVVYVGNNSSQYPIFSSFYANDETLQLGAVTVANVSLDSASVSTAAFTASFTTPNIVEIPGGVPVLAIGETGVRFPVRGLAAGTTTLKLTRDGVVRTVNFTVVTTPTLYLSMPLGMVAGQTAQGSVSVNCALANDLVLPLTSATPAVATVTTGSLTLRTGFSNAFFGLRALAAGSSVITAGTGPMAAMQTVTVTP